MGSQGGGRVGIGDGVSKEDVPADADCKGAVVPIAALNYGHLATDKGAGAVEDLVRVAVFLGGGVVGVGVRGCAIVGVGHFGVGPWG